MDSSGFSFRHIVGRRLAPVIWIGGIWLGGTVTAAGIHPLASTLAATPAHTSPTAPDGQDGGGNGGQFPGGGATGGQFPGGGATGGTFPGGGATGGTFPGGGATGGTVPGGPPATTPPAAPSTPPATQTPPATGSVLPPPDKLEKYCTEVSPTTWSCTGPDGTRGVCTTTAGCHVTSPAPGAGSGSGPATTGGGASVDPPAEYAPYCHRVSPEVWHCTAPDGTQGVWTPSGGHVTSHGQTAPVG